MPIFTYRARDSQGQLRTGTSEAENLAQLSEGLRSSGMAILEIRKTAQRGLPPCWHPSWLLPMNSLDVELGLRQLASMLRSGVSILTALKTASDQSVRPRAARVWASLDAHIRKGGSLSDAMERHRAAFGPYVTQLIRVGEHSGGMDLAMTRAAEHLELHRNVRMMVLNALIYPLLATGMAFAVTAYLVVIVIPKIAAFLESGGSALPALTQALMDLSLWARLNGLHLLAGAAGVTAACLALRRWPPGRDWQDALELKTHVAGHILRLSATAVFARGMGMLIDSGVTLLDALEVVRHLLANSRLRRRVGEARLSVMRGEALAASLERAPEFLPMLGRMTAVAETTGTLGPTLNEVARFHEDLLVITIKRWSVSIEPVVIVLTGGIVGFVYIAFFVALFSMASTV
jgi:type IV pilus assembly protein PilC